MLSRLIRKGLGRTSQQKKKHIQSKPYVTATTFTECSLDSLEKV